MENNVIEQTNDNITAKALKAGIWYTVSTILVRATGIITTPVFTRLMSTNDYGIVATFNSWQSLLVIIFSLNLGYSIGRAKLDFKGKLNQYEGSMCFLSLFVTFCACVAAAIFLKPLLNLMELDGTMMAVLALNLLFTPIVIFHQNKLRYEYRYKGNIAISVFTTVAGVIFSLSFIWCFSHAKYFGKALGTTLPSVVLGIVFLILMARKKVLKPNRVFWNYGMHLSLPMVAHTVSLNLLAQSDRIVITKFCGTEWTGIYSLAYQYALLISIVTTAVSDAWLPWFHDKLYAGCKREIARNVKPFVMLGCMLGIGCIAVGPEAIYILGGDAYKAGVAVVMPVVGGTICQYIYSHYVNIELHLKNTKYVAAGTIFAASTNIVLNLIFVPRFGFVAAAYTTLFSYFILMVVHYFISKKIMKMDLYDDKYMFGAMLVTILIAAAFTLLYPHTVIRYVALAVLCGLYFALNRKFIRGLLRQKGKLI